MLKNVIKSDSFFYHDFINSRQSQDRQDFALKAASRKISKLFLKLWFEHQDGIQIAVLPRKYKVWAAIEASPKLIDKTS